MSEIIRLSDIVGRSIPIEWYEAVAIVSGVSERVRDELAGMSVPELHQIGLLGDGNLSFAGAFKTDEPVRRLGQLLQAVLVSSSPPVQLRLISSQATSPSPAFASVREYLEALTYFERPDRAVVLRELYERCKDLPLTPGSSVPTLDTIAPLVSARPESEEKVATPHKHRDRRALPLIAAAMIVIVGGFAYWRVAPAASGEQVSTLALKASDALGGAVVSGISSVTDTVGLGRLAPANPGGSKAPAAPVPAAPAAAPGAMGRSTRAAKTPTGRQMQTPEPALLLFDLGPPAARIAATVAPPPDVSTTVTIQASEPRGFERPDVIYSATDVDVKPPVGIRPQLPAELPAGVEQSQLGQIELLVLPDGSVGAVRLLTARRRVPEAMLLSAAKAWRFLPAMRDGRAVSYRKIVWLSFQ